MRLNVKPLKKSWNAFLTISWKTFVQLQAVELGDQQKGVPWNFQRNPKFLANPLMEEWKLRIRTIPPNPPIFFVEVLFRFSRLMTTMTFMILMVFFFPRLPVVGYVFLPREGNLETSFQAKAGGLGVDLGRFLGFGHPWQALLARMACPRNLGKKNPLRLQICPQTDVR